jgi:hypothetical protein
MAAVILASPDVAALMAAYDSSPSPGQLRILADAVDEAGGEGAKCRILADWQEKAKALDIPHEGYDELWAAKNRLAKVHELAACHLWACLCVRYCPLHDGRRMTDLLTDDRSQLALSGAELHWLGLLSQQEIDSRRDAANDAYAAYAAANAANAAYAAYAAYAAAYADANDAYAANDANDAYAANGAYAAYAAYAAANAAAAAADARRWAVRLATMIQEGWQP